MLLSSGPAPAPLPRSRRNSFDAAAFDGDGEHHVHLSTSAPSLLGISPPRGSLMSVSPSRRESHHHMMHHAHTMTTLAPTLAPMPEKETFKAEEKKSEELELPVWDKTRVWEWYNNL